MCHGWEEAWSGERVAHWLVVFVFKKQTGMRAAEAGQAGDTQLGPLSADPAPALGHLLGVRVQRLAWGRVHLGAAAAVDFAGHRGCRWHDRGQAVPVTGDDSLWAQSPHVSSERSFCRQKTFLIFVGLRIRVVLF